jgi:hypothetical protein
VVNMGKLSAKICVPFGAGTIENDPCTVGTAVRKERIAGSLKAANTASRTTPKREIPHEHDTSHILTYITRLEVLCFLLSTPIPLYDIDLCAARAPCAYTSARSTGFCVIRVCIRCPVLVLVTC